MQITSGAAPPEYTVNTSVVLVLFGYSKGARKVSGKCIKGTHAVLRGFFKVPGCQSLASFLLMLSYKDIENLVKGCPGIKFKSNREFGHLFWSVQGGATH